MDTIEEVKEVFDKAKKEIKFNISFEELDENFSFVDKCLNTIMGTNNPGALIRNNIMDKITYVTNYLYSLAIPSNSSMIVDSERNLFTDEDAERFIHFIDKLMYFNAKQNLTTLNLSVEKEKEFIDESVEFYIKVLKPELKRIYSIIEKYWKDSFENNKLN